MSTPIGRNSMSDIPEWSGTESVKQKPDTPQLKGSSIPQKGAAAQAAVPKAVTPSTGRAAAFAAALDERKGMVQEKLAAGNEQLGKIDEKLGEKRQEIQGALSPRLSSIGYKLAGGMEPRFLNIFDKIVYTLNKGKIAQAIPQLKEVRNLEFDRNSQELKLRGIEAEATELEKTPERAMLKYIRSEISDMTSVNDVFKFINKNLPEMHKVSHQDLDEIAGILENLQNRFQFFNEDDRPEASQLFQQMASSLPTGVRNDWNCRQILDRLESYINPPKPKTETPPQAKPTQPQEEKPAAAALRTPTAPPTRPDAQPAAQSSKTLGPPPRKPLPMPQGTAAASTSAAPIASKPEPKPAPAAPPPAPKASQPQAASSVGRPQQYSSHPRIEFRNAFAVLEKILGREPESHQCKAVQKYLVNTGLGEKIEKLDIENISLANGLTQAVNTALTPAHKEAILKLLDELW